MKTVILVPVLARPQNVAPLVDSIEANTPEPHRVLFIASRDDEPEIEALERAHQDFLIVGTPGTYAAKINVGFHESDEPLVFSAADDLRFHAGWLSAALAVLGDGVEVAGTNDLGNPRTIDGSHSTHSLFTRRYIDDPGGVIDQPGGVVLNEQYPHSWVDDEFICTAKFRGVYAHAADSHVEHMHWLWGKGDPAKDYTYRLGEQGHRVGQRIFQRRRRLWRKRK